MYLDCLDSLDSIASSVQVHLPEAGTSLSFFGEDPQSRVIIPCFTDREPVTP